MAPKDYSTYLKLERLKEENNTQKLIRLYRDNECLWNPQSSGYHSASVKDDAWRRVTRLMNSGLTPDQVKLQVLALRNYYDKECAAIRKSQLEGYSYVPRHAYFEDLHFLKDPDGLTDPKGDEGSLVNALVLKDERNDSEETICEGAVSLCPGSSETKDNYTYYKLILEPEQGSLSIKSRDGVEGIIGRSASGNDRWYPTSYCVKCGQETGENPCIGCCGRGKRFCAPREPSLTSLSQDDSYYSMRKPQRRNQFDDDQCSYSRCSQPRQNFRSNYQQSQSQGPRYQESSCDSVCSESTYVDMDNGSDDWPSPHLCGQRRPKVTPRYRYVVSDHGLKECCSSSWERNNEAICRRLQAQLAKQSNQNKCSSPSQNSGRGSCNRNFRYQSGEDELNVMLLKDCRCRQSQAINCQCAVHSELYNNNSPQQVPGSPNPQPQTPPSENPPMQVTERYNDDQMEVPDRYNIEQKNYSSFPCDCQCNSFRQQPHQPPSYYQQNQYEEGPTSYPLPAMPDTTAQMDQYGEMGVPCPFLTNFDPSTAEPQAHVYCYSTEMWPQDTGMCESCKRQNKSCWSTCPVYRRSNDDRSELACDTVCNGPCSSNRGATDNRNFYSEESGGVVNQKIPSNNLEELPRVNKIPDQEGKSLDGRQRADVGESSDERSRGRPYSRGNNEEPSVRSQRDVALDPFLEENFCNEAACREGRDCRIGYEDRPRQKTDRNDERSMNSNYSNQRRRIREDVPGHENPENQQIQQQPLNENYVQDQKFKAYPLSTDVSQFGKCPESCPKYRRNGDYREDRKPMPSADRKNQEWNGENISSRSKGLDDRDYQDGQRGSVSSRSKGPEVPLPPGYESENVKPRAKTRPQEDRSYQEQNRENMSSRSRGPEDSNYQDRNRGSISSTSKGPEAPAPPEYGSENEKPQPKIRPKEEPLPDNNESDNDQPQPKTRALDDRSYQEANRSVSSKSKDPEQPDYESENEQPVKKSNKMPRSKVDSDAMEERQIGRYKSNYEDQEENLNSRRRSFDEKTIGSSNRYDDNCVEETCPNMGARNRQRNDRNNNTEVPGCNNKTCPRLKSISYLRGGDGRRYYRESFNVEDQNRNYGNERRRYRPQEDRRTRRQFECNDCTNDTCPYREEENVDYSDEPLPSRQKKDRRTNRRTNDENCTRDTCLYRDDEEKSYSNGRRTSRSRKNPTNRNADTEAILPEEDDRNKNYSKKRPQKGRITNRDADENFCTDKTCRYKKKDSSKQNETEERNKRRKSTESEKILSDNEKNYTRGYKNNGDADEDFCTDGTCKYNRNDTSKKDETEEKNTRRKSTESEKIKSDNEKNYNTRSKNDRDADEDFCSDETCKYNRNDTSKQNEREETRRKSTESEKILSDNEKNYKTRSKNDRDVDEDFCSDDTCKYNRNDSSKQNETEERNTRRRSTESEKILSDNEKNYKARSKNDRDADEDFCSDETCKYKRKDSSKLNDREGRIPRRKFNESEKILSDNERNYTKKSRNNSPPKSPRYQPRTRSVEKRKKPSPSSKNSNNDDCDCDWEEKLREERSERYRNPIYDEESEERYQNDSSKGGDRSGRGFLNYHLANPNDDDYYSDDDRGNYTERDTRKKRNLDDCRCIEEAPATSSRRKGNGRSQRSDAPRYDNRSKRDDFDNGYDENEEAYDRNRNPKPAPPKEMNVTETSPYLSEYDCLYSDEELYQRNDRDQKGKSPFPKDDQNQETTKNPPTDETKDQQSTDDDKKPQETEENVCECHSDSDEKMKADDPEADGVRVTRSSAGNGLVSSKSPFLSKVKRNVPLGITILAPISINNKQFEVVEKFPIHDMTTFSLKEQVQGLKTSSQDSARNPIPVKKKPTHNNTGASTSFAKPSKPSPNRRGSVTPKSQMVEPIKRRTQVSSHSNPQSKHMTPLGNRRPTTRKQEYTKDSDNCKFLFDINSAQYYICKLQDDGSANQYLILMPMEAIGGLEGLGEVPGQSSAKDRRYCPRQSSGFQSVSWAHPESTNQSQESQQSERRKQAECNPILDTIELNKSHITSEVTDPKKSIPISRKMRRKVATKPMTSKARKPSQKVNTKGIEENRTPKGDMENLDQPIVFLHPPVADFRPSRYSFDKETVEQHTKVPDIVVHPAPKPLAKKAPKPPVKPKRTVLR